MNIIVSNKYEQLLNGLEIDVISRINGVFSVENLSRQYENFFYNKMIIDITAIENYEDINTIQQLSLSLDTTKLILLLDDSVKVNSQTYLSQLVSMGIYNFTKSVDAIKFLIDNPNSYKDVAKFHQLNMNPKNFALNDKAEAKNNQVMLGRRIIGVRNLTEHAGATTLTYIMKKHLEKLYKVKAAEIDKEDFSYFRDSDLFSIRSDEVQKFLNENSDTDIILLDMSNNDFDTYCTEVIYLIEPGLVKLNKLIRDDNRIFEKMRGKKIVLNRSVLSSKDVTDFERESGSEVFYSVANIDDKMDNIKVIKDFLLALGFSRFNDDGSGFNLFY